MPEPKLIDVSTPRDPRAVVLVLHGGASRPDSTMVSPTQLSVLRMKPVASRVARAGRGRLAVLRLLNSHRGWDPRTTPVDDVRWALAQVADRFGDLPVGLVGHSLGGRAALLAGAAPAVRSVVALNPWVMPADDAALGGTRVLVAHGDHDRIASIDRAHLVAEKLSRRTEVEFVVVPGGKHAMLRHGWRFEQLAADFTVASLLDD